jgi:hypothetical protein
VGRRCLHTRLDTTRMPEHFVKISLANNCTQTGPVTIEWSTTEDTTEYTVANQLTSTDADDIKGFSGVNLKTRINAACTRPRGCLEFVQEN